MIYILDEKGYIIPKISTPISYIKNENNCYISLRKPCNKAGHRRIGRNGKTMWLHRYVYELYNGDIPEKMVVMHICDNPACINPEHLKLGSQSDNIKDSFSKGRKEYKKLLEDSEIFQIKQMLLEGRTIREIASFFNISHTTVNNIKKGKIIRYCKLLNGSYSDWIKEG